MRKHSTVRRSRRAPPLKDSDYDHEIALVDHAAEAVTAEAAVSPQPPVPPPEPPVLAAGQTHTDSSVDAAPAPEPEPRPSSSYQIGRSGTHSLRHSTTSSASSTSSSTASKKSNKSKKSRSRRKSPPGEVVVIPTVEVNREQRPLTPFTAPPPPSIPHQQDVREADFEVEPTPVERPQQVPASTPKGSPHRRCTPESGIDVLYENERGGFLCGMPLFSSKALGQLDPPNWTNAAHKPSPTSINTAQVPDPSWTWAWPEWHVNQDVGADENGWEYSFMFTKIFSWHPPRWYNSFVRRRAWTRKRVKRDPTSNDPHMLNTEYFTVRPSAETNRSGSIASRASLSVSSWVAAGAGEKPDIEDIETLMAILKGARIDREKLEAVGNFLEHGEEELVHLQHKMHDIMAIFIFQASRRALLFKLNHEYEKAMEGLKDNDTGSLQRRSNNLKAATRHADEECRRLEYWSDIKKLVREGTVKTGTDKCEGWDETWRGVDNSGPPEPDTSRSES